MKTIESLPDLGIRVLIYDSKLTRWVIGQLQQNQGTMYWVFDPKIFHGVDNNRYTHWQDLPENP